MIYEDIPQFKEGEVVFLKSDLQHKTPMTVVSDYITEVREEIEPDDPMDWFTPGYKKKYKDEIIKNRYVSCKWFNSQRKVENRLFNPPELVSINAIKTGDSP